MLKRIIDKQTGVFLRDDFEFDETIEIGLEKEPAQGLYRPKWSGTDWIEDMTQEEIDALNNQPTEQTTEELLEQRINDLELYILMQEGLI